MKTFISHSSKDKKRFVQEFARKLRSTGIDAWLDKWEMSVGDSIVDRIFEEGIKNCDVFIIILSKNSINSKWVKEELNAGFIKNIEKQTKVIPIIIDNNIEIPIVLSSRKWIKIKDLKSYNTEFEDITNSILNISKKPLLGKQPRYTIEISNIGELSQIDSIILKIIVEYILDNNKIYKFISGKDLITEWKEYSISQSQVEESIEILSDESYINNDPPNQGWFACTFSIPDFTYLDYAQQYIEDFDKKFRIVISKIVNDNIMKSDILSQESDLHIRIVNALISEWEDNNYIKYTLKMATNFIFSFQEITAMGKRYFKEQLEK